MLPDTSLPVSNWHRTIVATAVPPITPQPRSSGSLFSVTNPTSSPYPNYIPYSFAWVATGSSAALSFFFRNDPGGWMLDDVTVYHGRTQLITNGGFEAGNLGGWVRSGTCFANIGQAYSNAQDAHKGNWYYYDPCSLD